MHTFMKAGLVQVCFPLPQAEEALKAVAAGLVLHQICTL